MSTSSARLAVLGMGIRVGVLDGVAAFEQALWRGDRLAEQAAGSIDRAAVVAEAMLGAGVVAEGLPIVDEPTLPRLLDAAGAALRGGSKAVVAVSVGDGAGAALVLALADEAVSSGGLATIVSGLDAGAIGHVELSGPVRAFEADRVVSAQRACSLGMVGDLGAASGVVGLVKLLLVVRHRYRPVLPGWTAPEQPSIWPSRGWFVPTEPMPWFAPAGVRRVAALSHVDADGGASCVQVMAATAPVLTTRSRPASSVRLVTVAGRDAGKLDEALQSLEERLDGSGWAELWQEQQELLSAQGDRAAAPDGADDPGERVVALVAGDVSELRQEILAARRGIPGALAAGGEWQTPRGSYFTARPLGGRGGVAFVYPGAASLYPGMARGVFRSFPTALAHLEGLTDDAGGALAEELVYPRRVERPGARALGELEARLGRDPVSAMAAGTACAAVYTHVVRDILNVQPTAALGYSLGEASMLWALGVWGDGDASRARFRASPLFRTRLGGQREALRSYRAAAGFFDGADDALWATYTLMAPREAVEPLLRELSLAFLTLVNGPNEVVIAGDPGQCRSVVERLGCEHVAMPFDAGLHCPPAMSELDELVRLNTNPTSSGQAEGITLYSADEYGPLTLEQDALAGATARATCKRLDFPRLVRRAYDDGARIFVEVGPSGSCARLVSGILAGEEHVALSVDRRRVDADVSIARTAARLVSHGVPVDLGWLDHRADMLAA